MSERNTGRTYRALKRAIQSLDACPVCIYLVRHANSVEDLDPLVWQILKEIPSWRVVSRHKTGSYLFSDGALFQIRVADGAVARGCRAHFVIDHWVKEDMDLDEYGELIMRIHYCDPLGCDTSDETPKEAV